MVRNVAALSRNSHYRLQRGRVVHDCQHEPDGARQRSLGKFASIAIATCCASLSMLLLTTLYPGSVGLWRCGHNFLHGSACRGACAAMALITSVVIPRYRARIHESQFLRFNTWQRAWRLTSERM